MSRLSRLHSKPAEPQGPEPFDPEAALRVIRKRTPITPRTGLILGSGLGVVADHVAWDAAFPTTDIPGLPRPTVTGRSVGTSRKIRSASVPSRVCPVCPVVARSTSATTATATRS